LKNESEFIVREGIADDSALIIVSGRVAVCRRDLSSEIDSLLAELDEGEMFDAMAWLTDAASGAGRRRRGDDQQHARPVGVRSASRGSSGSSESDDGRRWPTGSTAAARHTGFELVNCVGNVVPISFIHNRLTLSMAHPSVVDLFASRRVASGEI
jgi:hypothetical protein